MRIPDLSPLNLNPGFELMFFHWVLLNYIDIFISIEIWPFKFSYDYLEWVRWEFNSVHEKLQARLKGIQNHQNISPLFVFKKKKKKIPFILFNNSPSWFLSLLNYYLLRLLKSDFDRIRYLNNIFHKTWGG